MSSYGRAAPPHHNYELFSIVRLVGISNQLGSDLDASKGDKRNAHRSSMSKSTGMVEEQRVTILHVAAGGYVDHSFVAMALSNDTIIFRFVGDSGVPVVRQMAWTFKDQHDKRIVAMSFNPTAQWLMVLAADATVVLIPIYFLMCKKNLGDFEEKATPSSPPLPTSSSSSSSANSESDSDPTSSPDIIKPDAAAKNKLNRELNTKEEIRLVLHLVTVYICKPDTPRNIKEREKGGLLGREYLLLQVLQYWKLRSIPIEPLEAFILENLTNLSDPLCHILENPPSSSRALSFSPLTPRTRTNVPATPPSLKLSVGPTSNPMPPPSVSPLSSSSSSSSSSAPPPNPPKPPESLEHVLPWVLEFSSQLYTKVVHFSLQRMVQDTEKETPVSEGHLWGGIKENMEKELSRREAIVIQHLSAPTTPKVHDGSDSKDVAFTCGHHMTRRALVGHVVPQLLQRLEMFPVAIPATTRLIVACYKLKMIPLACPMCLYNYMREAVPSGDTLRAWQV